MNPTHMYRRVSATAILLLGGDISFLGCATSPPTEHAHARQAIIGKTKEQVLSCAGKPIQELQTSQGTVLRYYKEAPMFEESTVFLKGSRPAAHHGCWASLLLAEHRIVGAEYKSAPESLEEVRLCEQIFESCPQ